MFVRRLTAWFSRLATSVTVHLRRPAASPALRQPVLTGAVSYDHEQRTFSIGSASGRWLDDARRLRPHIVSPRREAQRWSGKPSASGPSASAGLPDRATQLPARPMPPLPASVPPAMPPLPEPAARTQPLPPRTSEPKAPAVPGVPVPADPPAAPRAAGSSSAEPDQQLQRRLRSLRFLVRHGVYNEGFAPGAAPKQYHYSLGLDESESELDA